MDDRVRVHFRCGTFISVCNDPPRSTQPGRPFVGRCNEYQQKSVTPCGWGVKAGMEWFVCGWQVELCDPIVTHEPYLSALEINGLHIKLYINLSVYFYCTLLALIGRAPQQLKSWLCHFELWRIKGVGPEKGLSSLSRKFFSSFV